MYDEYLERFAAYEKDLEKLRQSLQQLHDCSRQLLQLKQATAQHLKQAAALHLCHSEELHVISSAIGDIGDAALESFDSSMSEQYKTQVLGIIAKEQQYCSQLLVLHARRDRKRKDYDAFRREVAEMELKQPQHKEFQAAKERLERSERECVCAAWRA